MIQWIPKVFIPIELACLVFISNPQVHGATLHDDALVHRAQGYEAQQRGDRVAALEHYRKAVAMDPTYAVPLNDIGILLEEDGRFEEAERAYLQAIAVSPYYLGPYTNLALLYERMGQKEKAAYYWMKRTQLGTADDPWTQRAQERLQALGVALPPAIAVTPPEPPVVHRPFEGKTAPPPAAATPTSEISARRRVIDHVFHEQDESTKEFHAATEAHGNWP